MLGAPPFPLTPLIGREREIASVCALVRRDDVRLVTLTGPGGGGKTRLALQIATKMADDFPGGIAFVSLAPIRDPALVLPTVARTLGMRESTDRTVREQLADWFAGRPFLLVLDNLEQVTSAATDVADLLACCPSLTILATSRVVLRVSGEHRFPVPPLALPDPTHVSDLSLVAGTEAVTLFVHRAQAADPDFVLTEATAPLVTAICARLDGLPLAIELAAGRVPTLPLRVLLARLERALPLLSDGARDQPVRLQTMRAAIAWSYDLLSSSEQSLFRRMAVFVGGFTLGAAEAVAESGGCGIDVLDGIGSLAAASLLLPVGELLAEEPRYRMLETVREFGLEQLIDTGEETATRAAHAAFFAALADRADAATFTAEEDAWFARLDTEHANLRAALTWAEDTGDTVLLARLATGLVRFWIACGHLGEGGAWVARAERAGTALPPPLRARLACAAGWAAHFLGDERAEPLLAEGLALGSALGDDSLAAQGLLGLAGVASNRGDLDRAEALAAEATARWRALGRHGWVVVSLLTQGFLSWRRGASGPAAAFCEEALALARDAGFAGGVAHALGALGAVALLRGDHRRAAAGYAEALAIAHALGYTPEVLDCLARLTGIAPALGQAERAARLAGSTEALRAACGLPIDPATRPAYDEGVAAAGATLGEVEFTTAEAAGRALAPDEAIAEALAVAVTDAGLAPVVDRTPELDHGLTSREVEVLRLLTEGKSDREIAETLFVSRHTAANHVGSILGKLGVPSRAAAAAFAVRHGLA